MASRIGMLMRAEKATERIDAALATLQATYDLPDGPPVTRDRALRDTLRLEYLADVLEIIASDEDEPDNLKAKSRAELNELASEHGVEDADKLPNKDAVIAAIDAAIDGEG